MTNEGKTAIFAILFRVDANPGKRQALVNFLDWDRKESIEKERGTIRFDVFSDPENEDRFYVYEAYEDATAFEEHQRHEPFKRWSSHKFESEVIFQHRKLRRLRPVDPGIRTQTCRLETKTNGPEVRA